MMKHKTSYTVISLVILMMITLIGCGADDAAQSQQEPAPEASAAAPADETSQQEDAEPVEDGVVVIEMFTAGGRNYNDPIGVLVEPGTTIRFINRSGMHSSTAYHSDNGRDNRTPDGATGWDSGLLTRRDATFEVTLTEEGVYDYFCIPHETVGHVGRIVVGDPDAAPALPTDGLPAAAADALPSVDAIMNQHVVRL